MSAKLDSIIACAQAGHARAIHALYEAYADPVRRYCCARLGDFDAAQDCTQEVFLRLWQGIQHFEDRGAGSFTAWLYTITNHVLISYVRKQHRAQQVALPPNLALSDPHPPDSDDLLGDRVFVHEAMRQLPRAQQHVITLKFFVGMSTREIAASLGRTEGAIKARQARALHRLHHLLVR